MPRKSYVWCPIRKDLIPKEEYYAQSPESSQGRGPTVLPDQPDFVSPIDGRVYSGRAGMREHNLRHNVVSNRDLKGLPTLTSNSDFRSPEQKRASAEHRKRMVINEVNRHYK